MITRKPGTILVEKTKETTTGRVGLHWVSESMRHVGLKKKIEYRFRARKNNREKSAWEKIEAAVLTILSGGSCVEDLEYLRADAGLLHSLGKKEMISADTLLRFMGKKRTGEQLTKNIHDSAQIAVSRYRGTELTYDNDATYFNSNKNCATYSYKKEKQMSGLLGYIAELNGICITAQYRPGNISPATGILDDLKQARLLCKKSGKRLTRFRSDSAAHNFDIFKYCDTHDIKYFVTLDKNSVTKREVKALARNKWKRLPEKEGVEWAEYTHAMNRGKKNGVAMRALVLRWPNPDPSLFDCADYCYHIIATNDWDIEPMTWLQVHNQRMNSENYHKEVKSSLAAAYSPSHDFHKNLSFFMLNLLAYNALVLFKSFYLPVAQKAWTIKTFRYRFIHICGRFVAHARSVICKLINVTDESFSLFKSCAATLCLSG